MNNIRKWWSKNHPLKSKYISIRISWFMFAVPLATMLSVIASLGTASITFYEEMEDWCRTVKTAYYKLYDKEEKK